MGANIKTIGCWKILEYCLPLITQYLISEELAYVIITASMFIRYNRRVCGSDFRNRQEGHTWIIRHWGH
jgi:hypothetical protein